MLSVLAKYDIENMVWLVAQNSPLTFGDNVEWHYDNVEWHYDNVEWHYDNAEWHYDNVEWHHDNVEWPQVSAVISILMQYIFGLLFS